MKNLLLIGAILGLFIGCSCTYALASAGLLPVAQTSSLFGSYIQDAVPDEYYATILFFQVRNVRYAGNVVNMKAISFSWESLHEEKTLTQVKLTNQQLKEEILKLNEPFYYVISEDKALYYEVNTRNSTTIYWWSPYTATWPS